MSSELDRKFDAVLAAVTGPGGRIVIGEDAQGRAIVTNFPPTLPSFFKTFCALNGAVEAIVAGDERLTFADLDCLVGSPCQGAGRARDRQGRPRRHRHAQLPQLGRHLHGRAQGGGGGDADQRLVAERRTGARARPRRAETGHRRRPARRRGSRRWLGPMSWCRCRSTCTSTARSRPCSTALRTTRCCPRSPPTTTPPSCSPRARPARPRARCRPTAPSRPASTPTPPAS